MIRIVGTAVMVLGLTQSLSAQQPLSLRDALARAETRAYGNRMATARADAQQTQRLAALRGVLPTVRLEAGYVRTTDPIGAFGNTLRQRQIDQAAFDPQRLNYPPASTDYTSALVVEMPLLNTDAHLGRKAAASAATAARASASWTITKTRVDVIRAYYGAVLAAEKTLTLEAALKAAQAHVRQAEQLVKSGLATKSDALLASVKAGEVETQLIEARGDAEIATQSLAMMLGDDANSSYALPGTLPSANAVRALLDFANTGGDVQSRRDVTAAHAASRASELDVARALSLYLPRFNGVARYDWHSDKDLWGGDNNWTVGVMASWTPFAGASEIAERRAAEARAAEAKAGVEAVRAQASLEIAKAIIDERVALNRLAIAERSEEQSRDAHRIVARKYEGGLATVVELLQAAATETQSQLALSHARYTGITAAAEGLKVRGRDPAALAEKLPPELLGAR